MSDYENRIARIGTEELIWENPISVTLNRYRREKTSAGGYKDVLDAILTPQLFRIIEDSMRPSQERVGADGTVREVSFTLLGYHDANIQDGDRFDLNGDEYMVMALEEDRRWATRAEVARYAV